VIPSGSITTDLIVGFPSETDRDFERTCDIMKEVGFDSAYTFKYSPRTGTKASGLADNVAAKTKAERLDAIMRIQCGISETRNKMLLSETVEVLVEDVNKKDVTQLSGKTRTNKQVLFKADKSLVGGLVNVEVESVTAYSLRGRISR